MVRSFFKIGISAITSKQTNIFSAAFFIIATTVLSQVLGVLKYRLLVSIFGASSDLGVFLAAFRIPDFLFQILIASALSSVFIPVYSEYMEKANKREEKAFVSSIINGGVVLFVFASIIISLFPFQFARLVAPGFSEQELWLMADLMRIILLSQVFFILGTVATGILQAHQRFLIPGIASALYNGGIIIGLILLSKDYGIYGASVGVVIGSLLFFLSQLPLLIRVGFFYGLQFHLDEGIKRVAKLTVPKALTMLVTQAVITANVFFASFISARGLVVLDLAQTLMAAPVILFGQSIAQASFPSLTLKRNNKKEFLEIFVASFNQILYLTLPISVLFIVLRIPVVRLFYGASRFDWDATVATGMTLALFAVSMGAQSLIYLLSRAFYAHKDTQTPFLITLISVIINIFLSFIFVMIFHLPIHYLALSFSISSIVSIVLMIIFIDIKVGLPKIDISKSVLKILIASLTMGFALYIPIKLLDQLVFDTTRTINLLILTGISSFLGILSYVFFTWLLDIREAYYIVAVLKKFSSGHKILRQIAELIDSPSSHNP